MQHSQYQGHNVNTGSKKTLTWIIVAVVVVVVLAVVLVITKTGKTEKTALIIENYKSISNGVVQYGDTATLDSNGYIVLDLIAGEYSASYTLEQCTNPSEKFDYTRTSPTGESMSYDPLKEKVIVAADGTLQKRTLSEAEQLSALTEEEVYVLEVQGIGDAQRKVMLYPDSFPFSADGQTRLSFRAKCDNGSVTFKVYEG